MDEKTLIKEIKTLQKAAKIHANYSISQYKKVLKYLEKIENEKKFLEEKVKERTQYLEEEMQQKALFAKKLANLAKYDQLTGLANRYMFLEELELTKKESSLLNRSFAILFIDLDGFKLINDTYGHETGDEVLKEVAKRIKSIVRKNDLVSRLGGDEFTVILKSIEKEKAAKLAKKIIKSISAPIQIDNLNLHVGASIGIYLYSGDISEDILAKADIAMYEVKKHGKGKYLFFDKQMEDKIKHIVNLKNSLQIAVKNKEFKNYFQPIVCSKDYKIKGVEVLLRWKVAPAEFIPLLEEEIELIKEVTFWQIEEIFKIANNFNIFFSLNLSVKILQDEDIIKFLKKISKKYKIKPQTIHFEVTESVLAQNHLKTSHILKAIEKLNFSISLDDFGTGYSSLSYIREFPFDLLKIDKSFIDNILNFKKDLKLLEAIIYMADILGMSIILEGVESEKQIKYLKKRKNLMIQGFYFYKPMPFEEFLQIEEIKLK